MPFLPSPKKLRWGIAGTGGISQQIAADLIAISSRHASSAAKFARTYNIPTQFDEYQSMLDADIDAVYIGTPHVTHFELAREALQRGRHVLCEKPIGLNATEVRELAAIASSSGAFLMEAMWMKFNPLYVRLREVVDAGAIGEIRSVRSSFGAPFPRDDSSRWKPGGSALLDQGIYPVTLTHMFLGEPSSITAAGIVQENAVDLSQNYTLNYPGGRFAQGASSMVDFLDQSASLSGTGGWITIDTGFWFASRFTIHRFSLAKGETTEIYETTREGNGYTPMLRAVTAAILRGEREHPLHTMDTTARIFDTLDEIRRQITAQKGHLLSTSAPPSSAVSLARGPEGQRRADLGDGTYLNPVFAGDHPDPAILRDGDDYYLTFSSFESIPGLIIWHSRNLLNWNPLGSALPAPIGNVFAVDMCKVDGRYYIYVPIIATAVSPDPAAPPQIYVIHAENMAGPWSEPINLGIAGHIDPGHVLGEDGHRYLFLSGVSRVRLTADGLATDGPVEHVYDGWRYPEDWVTEAYALEGPKLTRRGDWFYLTTAVGGTSGPPTGHMVTVSRSHSVNGPWEDCPNNPIIRTWDADEPCGAKAMPPCSKVRTANGGASITATRTASQPWAGRPYWNLSNGTTTGGREQPAETFQSPCLYPCRPNRRRRIRPTACRYPTTSPKSVLVSNGPSTPPQKRSISVGP
jgi:predicted dehydrogenase